NPGESEAGKPSHYLAAEDLIRKSERALMADVYRWTGHFPERTRLLLRQRRARGRERQRGDCRGRRAPTPAPLATLIPRLSLQPAGAALRRAELVHRPRQLAQHGPAPRQGQLIPLAPQAEGASHPRAAHVDRTGLQAGDEREQGGGRRRPAQRLEVAGDVMAD